MISSTKLSAPNSSSSCRRRRMRSRIAGFLILLSFVVSAVSATATRSSTWLWTTKTKSDRCDCKATIPNERKACGFYVWDIPSAILYGWCHRLLKDRVYEGKGGYLFVRYESNSILSLLYPCSRYSPNKCMICGGSYPDHLELWWSKHRYSPYDRFLDETYNAALIIDDEDDGQPRGRAKRLYNQEQRRNRRKNGSSLQQQSPRSFSSSAFPVQTLAKPPVFHFHKRYVTDVSSIVRRLRINSLEEQKKVSKKVLPQSKRYHIMVGRGDLTYLMPFGQLGGLQAPYTKKELFIDALSMLVHSCIDATINLQQREFAFATEKNSRASNRL